LQQGGHGETAIPWVGNGQTSRLHRAIFANALGADQINSLNVAKRLSRDECSQG